MQHKSSAPCLVPEMPATRSGAFCQFCFFVSSAQATRSNTKQGLEDGWGGTTPMDRKVKVTCEFLALQGPEIQLVHTMRVSSSWGWGKGVSTISTCFAVYPCPIAISTEVPRLQLLLLFLGCKYADCNHYCYFRGAHAD